MATTYTSRGKPIVDPTPYEPWIQHGTPSRSLKFTEVRSATSFEGLRIAGSHDPVPYGTAAREAAAPPSLLELSRPDGDEFDFENTFDARHEGKDTASSLQVRHGQISAPLEEEDRLLIQQSEEAYAALQRVRLAPAPIEVNNDPHAGKDSQTTFHIADGGGDASAELGEAHREADADTLSHFGAGMAVADPEEVARLRRELLLSKDFKLKHGADSRPTTPEVMAYMNGAQLTGNAAMNPAGAPSGLDFTREAERALARKARGADAKIHRSDHPKQGQR